MFTARPSWAAAKPTTSEYPRQQIPDQLGEFPSRLSLPVAGQRVIAGLRSPSAVFQASKALRQFHRPQRIWPEKFAAAGFAPTADRFPRGRPAAPVTIGGDLCDQHHRDHDQRQRPAAANWTSSATHVQRGGVGRSGNPAARESFRAGQGILAPRPGAPLSAAAVYFNSAFLEANTTTTSTANAPSASRWAERHTISNPSTPHFTVPTPMDTGADKFRFSPQHSLDSQQWQNTRLGTNWSTHGQ